MVSHTRRSTKGTRSKGHNGTRSKGTRSKGHKGKKSKALRKSKKIIGGVVLPVGFFVGWVFARYSTKHKCDQSGKLRTTPHHKTLHKITGYFPLLSSFSL